jgi:hypothetical protein
MVFVKRLWGETRTGDHNWTTRCVEQGFDPNGVFQSSDWPFDGTILWPDRVHKILYSGSARCFEKVTTSDKKLEDFF